MTKPNFIIIGAMKSATSTLHEQLALQDGIFMSTPKEPNFFSDDVEFAKGAGWYERLFLDAKAGDICGESSTHYTKLPDYPNTIVRMKEYFPDPPKLIYVIRHPIDRLVSHYIHQWSQNLMKCDINEAIERFPELISYSQYAKQLKPYIQSFGIDNVHILFSESLRENAQRELDKIAEFIGHKKSVHWFEMLPEQNVSKERVRRFKGYSLLIESKPMTLIRRLLFPKSLRNLVKQWLRMDVRPTLSESNQRMLEEIFNKDLAELSDWLNTKLDCNNYREYAFRHSIIMQQRERA